MVNGRSHETYCLKKIVYGLEMLPHMEKDAESLLLEEVAKEKRGESSGGGGSWERPEASI